MPPRNQGNQQKPKDAKRTLKRLGQYLLRSWPLLSAALMLLSQGREQVFLPEDAGDAAPGG